MMNKWYGGMYSFLSLFFSFFALDPHHLLLVAFCFASAFLNEAAASKLDMEQWHFGCRSKFKKKSCFTSVIYNALAINTSYMNQYTLNMHEICPFEVQAYFIIIYW